MTSSAHAFYLYDCDDLINVFITLETGTVKSTRNEEFTG